MRHTRFAGLTQLDPLDPFSLDDFSFQSVNPDITDRLLEVGARLHRHDGHVALADPLVAPSAVVVEGGGTIPSDTSIEFAYTLLDAYGGESAASPIDAITTTASIPPPDEPPTAVADYDNGGTLSPDGYYYALTWVDGAGGETTIGAIATVDVDPGFTSARVLLSDLTAGMIDAGATSWRLYRARAGNNFKLLATGTDDELTDDGSLCVDCTDEPPEENTTQNYSSVEVTVPALPSGATGWKLYGTLDSGLFDTFSYLSSGGAAPFTETLTNFLPTYGRPPTRSLTIAGAQKIDPDTEILDWHWKRPVETFGDLPSEGNEQGDVRLVEDTPAFYAWIDDEWVNPGGTATVARRESHTFAFAGELVEGVLPGMFLTVEDGASVALALAQHQLGAGVASATVRQNGTPLTDYTDIEISTNGFTDPLDPTPLNQFDYIDVEITAVAGATDLSLTLATTVE